MAMIASFARLQRVAVRTQIGRRLHTPNTTRFPRPLFRAVQQSRCYSDTSSSSVEAPAHLSEGERKIFDMIKSQLHPVTLEVSITSDKRRHR